MQLDDREREEKRKRRGGRGKRDNIKGNIPVDISETVFSLFAYIPPLLFIRIAQFSCRFEYSMKLEEAEDEARSSINRSLFNEYQEI